MAGHLFVLRGDLNLLRCSAVLVPCDSRWNVVWDHWAQLLPMDRFNLFAPYGARLVGGGGNGRFVDVNSDGEPLVRLVVTADDDREGNDDAERTAQWVSRGVVDAIADLSVGSEPVAGRVKPLIGLPLVGTGAGGFERRRGVLIDSLLPALHKVARDCNVDVALVLKDDRDHAAIQARRSSEYWPEFTDEQLETADRLGYQAAQGQLSLFLGSGVSVPLGLPDWKELLSGVAGRELPNFRPKRAPKIAQDIERELGGKKLRKRIAKKLGRVSGVAPTHLLLASLSVRETVTTNYDAAYERALDGSIESVGYRVLTRQLAQQPLPWVLKIHGDVNRPATIVITTEDYKQLQRKFGALQAVVESLLMTSHLMFVGFSMADADFVDAARRVRKVRALAEDESAPPLATVLALHSGAVSAQAGFEIVSMLDDPDDKEAARRLEMFLDRISWSATRQGPASYSFLLHPNYQDLFADDVPSVRLRELLGPLVARVGTNDPVCASMGWAHVEELLFRLGGRPPEHC